MNEQPNLGLLKTFPALERADLLAEPVSAGLEAAGITDALVAEIDPDLADTAAFCEAYEIPLAASANCVIVAARRGGETTYAACMVLATARADVNGAIRRRLGARKASFASMTDAVQLTAMEYGGITPVGVPSGWPVLVDSAVSAAGTVVIGSGLRRSKLALPAERLLALPDAESIELSLRTNDG